MDEGDEIVQEFLLESRENLDQLDRDLVLLEESAGDAELLARIFRVAHTIKGTCGFLGFSKLEAVTHAAETLLSRLRDGHLDLTREKTTLLLAVVDAIRLMLEAIEASGSDGDGSYEDLVAALRAAARPAPVEARLSLAPRASVPAGSSGISSRRTPAPTAQGICVEVHESVAPQRDLRAGPMTPPIVNGEFVSPKIDKERTNSLDRAVVQETVRVDVRVLDRLMDLAGELVLTRNQIAQVHGTNDIDSLGSASQRLNQVTTALQEDIMMMRLQPIDAVFSKFPRLVRDLAGQCGKQVQIEIDGKQTELDKTLIEAIKDPLTHLLRNAIDHGLESPERRQAAGKSSTGLISVRAFHHGGQVVIEISDDGAGIALDRVRDKAISRGLISADRAAEMSESELTSLLFLPGFSTAEKVTNVSGRGVGMDVVKTNVEKLGGTIDIHTLAGRGTTFSIRVPLTLAIVAAIVVEASGRRYAIPQVALKELVLLDGKKQRIELLHGAPVFRLRGKLLPLVFLSESLGHSSRASCVNAQKHHLAVLQSNGRSYGLVVDRVIDQQEIVVKPLPDALRTSGVYAGCTILGDGRVVLILDVVGIADGARVDIEDAQRPHQLPLPDAPCEARSLLLMQGPADVRLALPLERVARLETLNHSRIEEANGKDVVQYEDEIMPLLRLSDILSVRRADDSSGEQSHLNVVVLPSSRGHVGLVVNDVLDVVEVALADTGPRRRRTLVIQERVTEVLDVDWLLQQSGVLDADDSCP